ncbi:MAG: ATP-dependent DNA helicase RecG [Burkholderiales bacterium]|nr:ATP-dependent DNA helicase RecG [Burkholderiales bacterium]
MPTLQKALSTLLSPSPVSDLFVLQTRTSPEWERIKFDEMLAQQLMLRISRDRRNASDAPSIICSNEETFLPNQLIRSLPFKLTEAQQRAWQEILTAMGGPRPMNRLLQGDVGSGKTIVAALAALAAVDNGWQAAVMAPTEILAEQHYRKIRSWTEPLGISVVWLSGSVTTKDRRIALQKIESGEAQIIIGTHALIQQGVVYRKLGFAIVDEQQRFGVEQRLSLMSRTEGGTLMPHLLMLSATPIPRTLSLCYMADMDMSVIDELPPGRTPITTKIYRQSRKEEIAAVLLKELRAGKQAYWVCPLIEESEKVDLSAAEDAFRFLQEHLPGIKIELLHGRMAPEIKQATMDRFQKGETSLLVSTTVIEVGVDVPSAVIMVIDQAERFGLAQLHQLRGRIGRGSEKSFCIALYGENLTQTARERLKIFRGTQDGFKIAEKDLELRGPGEYLGARQSGEQLLRYANVNEEELAEKAVSLAEKWILNKDPRAEAVTSRWFESRENYLKA